MHNLHFIVTNASSAQKACEIVERDIEDWGTENNWRKICGAVSENNKVYEHDKTGRMSPKQLGITTIQKINKTVEEWMDGDGEAVALIKKAAKGNDLTDHEWWLVSEYAKKMNSKVKIPTKFNVLKHDFLNLNYDESGVTQLGYPKKKGEKTFVVFVDMHS